MDVQSTAGEGLERKEEYIIRSWRKGDPCYVVSGSLSELDPAIMWKRNLRNGGLGYLAEEISKQRTEISCYLE